MKIKIIGFVITDRSLPSPSCMLRWFIDWRMAQILGPALEESEKAMHKVAESFKALGDALREAWDTWEIPYEEGE